MANQYQSEMLEQRKISEKLLRRGLATVAELANFYGLPRQTVAVWARGIDVAEARKDFISRAIQRASARKR